MSLKMKKHRGSLSRNDLREIHAKRSNKAKAVDNTLQAPLAPTLRDWVKSPDEFDVSGVDYPVDYRSKTEKEQIALIDKYLPIKEKELQAAQARGDENSYIIWENIKLFKNQRELLDWQKKHPFIAAGTREFDYGYGKLNYEEALEKNINYGFDLRNPENSFIHTFHMKKQDVDGLRIMLEKNLDRAPTTSARAWYDRETHLFHLPPKSEFKGETDEWTNKTILHEIGHHIHTPTQGMDHFWAGTYYSWKHPSTVGKRHTGEISIHYIAPYEVIYYYREYFGNTQNFNARYDRWVGRGLNARDKAKIKPLAVPRRRADEMWAETFAQYRLGNISREIRWKKKHIIALEEDVERNKRIMRDFKGPKNGKQYNNLKRAVKEAGAEIQAVNAQYDNLLKFDMMMKRWDRSGWNPDSNTEMAHTKRTWIKGDEGTGGRDEE